MAAQDKKKKSKDKKGGAQKEKEPDDPWVAKLKAEINAVKDELDAKRNKVSAEFESEITSDAIKKFLKTNVLEITKHGVTLVLTPDDISASRQFVKKYKDDPVFKTS